MATGILLTDIAAEIAELIDDITIANGFTYDFGSINEPDMAHMRYPSADITYASEQVINDLVLAQYGFADAEFQIKIRSKLLTTEGAPLHAIDAEHDKIMHDIKHVFGVNRGALSLTGNPVITYKSFEKENAKAGDVFIPSALIIKWNVRYQN